MNADERYEEYLRTELSLVQQQLDMVNAGTFVKYNPDDTDEWLRELLEKRIVHITLQLVTG